jgi:hypothetical protein
MPDLDLRELRLFLVLAEELHFGRTASAPMWSPSPCAHRRRGRQQELSGTLPGMGSKIGYARWSTGKQDVEADRPVLLGSGVSADRLYPDRASRQTVDRVLECAVRARA